MSHRQSMGGSGLRDSSSRYNNSLSRRSSFGGKTYKDTTPQKDSRSMLEDWRRKTDNEVSQNNTVIVHKREFTETGSTALERYRMRKQLKLGQDENSLPPSGMPPRTISSAPTFDDDELTGDYSRVTLGTPAFSRRVAGGGRAARRRSLSVGSRHRTREMSPSFTQDYDGSCLAFVAC